MSSNLTCWSPQIFIRFGTVVMQTLRRSSSAPDSHRSESESLLPLSTWIALTACVGLDGVGVNADVGRCRNLLDPIALWNCLLSMRWYVRNVSSISSASSRRNVISCLTRSRSFNVPIKCYTCSRRNDDDTSRMRIFAWIAATFSLIDVPTKFHPISSSRGNIVSQHTYHIHYIVLWYVPAVTSKNCELI